MIEAAVAEQDKSKRAEAYRAVQKLGAERAWQLFTAHPSAVMATHDKLEGYVDNPAFMGPYFYGVKKR